MLKLFCVLFMMHFKCSETVNRIQKLSEFQSLFPDDYDKRTAPPQINEGKMLLLHKQKVLYLEKQKITLTVLMMNQKYFWNPDFKAMANI